MAESFDEYVQNYRKNHRRFFECPAEAWIDPFRIYGPLYYVGDRQVCVHLIDTGDGLLLLDAGFTQTVPMLVKSITDLGFDPKDIRMILLTHGHYDHMGAAELFRELYGCKLAISCVDAELIRTRDDFALTTLCREVTPLFKAPEDYDLLIEDGDTYVQGNVSIRMELTTGHTPGVLTFLFDVTEDGVTKRAGLVGGVGQEAMRTYFLDHFDLPHTIPETLIQKAEALKSEHVDIHLGNHPPDNAILKKREEQIRSGGNPFIDPAEWERFLSDLQAKTRETMRKSELAAR